MFRGGNENRSMKADGQKKTQPEWTSYRDNEPLWEAVVTWTGSDGMAVLYMTKKYFAQISWKPYAL